MVSMAALATLRQVVLVMAQDPGDHARVRAFVVAISLGLTALMAVIAFTPVGRVALEVVIGAPPHVAEAALPALQIFVAVPAVMGLRQFYSGLTMHQRRTSLVAAAAIGRLVLMAVLLLASESAAAYAIGRRYVGQAVAAPSRTLTSASREG